MGGAWKTCFAAKEDRIRSAKSAVGFINEPFVASGIKVLGLAF